MNDNKGLIGSATTIFGTIIAWLPVINLVVQIIAGIIAIAVGLMTLRHFYYKEQSRLKKERKEDENDIRHLERLKRLHAKEEESTT